MAGNQLFGGRPGRSQVFHVVAALWRVQRIGRDSEYFGKFFDQRVPHPAALRFNVGQNGPRHGTSLQLQFGDQFLLGPAPLSAKLDDHGSDNISFVPHDDRATAGSGHSSTSRSQNKYMAS